MRRIPLPGVPGESFFGGLQQGSNMMNQLMQRKMQQQQMVQQAEQQAQQQEYQRQNLMQQMLRHEQNLGLKQQEEERRQKEFEANRAFDPVKFQLLEAKIKSEQERAKVLEKGGNQRITAAVQEADILFDRDDPRHALYILNKSKQYMPSEQEMANEQKQKSMPEFAQVASHLENAVPMNNLPPGTQNLYRKQMNEELTQIDKAKQVKHAIGQAREITKNNPDMYKKAINIIANPEGNAGKIEKALVAFLPEQDVSAFMSLHKLYSDILTKQAQLNGMSRSVYALKLQQQAKPQVKNPDEVNEQIFKNIEHEIEPQIAREKALLYAMKHNQYLPYTKNYGTQAEYNNEIPTNISSPTPMGMMKGYIDGKEVEVDPEDRDDFVAAGGTIL